MKAGGRIITIPWEVMQEEYERSQELKRTWPLPKTLGTIAWAFNKICEGSNPWSALYSFTYGWYNYAIHVRAELVCEPLTMPEQETEYTRQWAAFCAASVEFLCDRYDVVCPEWVHDPRYILAEPWDGSTGKYTGSVLQPRKETVPLPFLRRNIFCGNRIFQNKYELFELMMEAYAQGITDKREAMAYARAKEKSIHGG
jgi:hypothetical protein